MEKKKKINQISLSFEKWNIFVSVPEKHVFFVYNCLFVTIYIIYIIHLKVHIFINADLNLVKYLSKTRHDLSSVCEKKASLNKWAVFKHIWIEVCAMEISNMEILFKVKRWMLIIYFHLQNDRLHACI